MLQTPMRAEGEPVQERTRRWVMGKESGYRAVPFTMNRKMVAASASVGRERNNIHGIMEVDITEPRRAAQQHRNDGLGGLSGTRWLQLIPGFLLRIFIRGASRSVRMMRRFGAIGVTAVGMFGEGALWFVPLSGATVAVAVGSIVERPVAVEGRIESREHLCLTLSASHTSRVGISKRRIRVLRGHLSTTLRL